MYPIQPNRLTRQGSYGKQIKNRGGSTRAEVLLSDRAALQTLRSAEGRLSQVRRVPHLFPEAGRSRVDSGR